MNVGMHCLFLHLLHLLHSVFDCLISFSFSLCFIIITAIDSVVWLCCIFMSQGCLSKQMTEQINHFHLTTISSISTAKRKFWYHSNSSSSSICLVFFSSYWSTLLMRAVWARLLKHRFWFCYKTLRKVQVWKVADVPIQSPAFGTIGRHVNSLQIKSLHTKQLHLIFIRPGGSFAYLLFTVSCP